MKRYVVGFMHTADKVALVRKSRPEWQAGKLNGIGGKIEEGESPLVAMVREFGEETGVKTALEDWEFRAHLSGIGWKIYFYSTQANAEYPLVNQDQTEPCGWHPKYPLPPDTVPNLRWLVPFCTESLIVPAYLYQHTHE